MKSGFSTPHLNPGWPRAYKREVRLCTTRNCNHISRGSYAAIKLPITCEPLGDMCLTWDNMLQPAFTCVFQRSVCRLLPQSRKYSYVNDNQRHRHVLLGRLEPWCVSKMIIQGGGKVDGHRLCRVLARYSTYYWSELLPQPAQVSVISSFIECLLLAACFATRFPPSHILAQRCSGISAWHIHLKCDIHLGYPSEVSLWEKDIHLEYPSGTSMFTWDLHLGRQIHPEDPYGTFFMRE